MVRLQIRVRLKPMKTRRIQFHIRLAGILSVACMTMISCAGLPRIPEKPGIKSVQVVFQKLSLREATVLLTLELENPNAFSVRAGVVQYELMFDGRKVLSGETVGNFVIESNGVSSIPIILEIPFRAIGLAAGSVFSGGEVGYTVSGEVGLSGLLAGVSIPISHSGFLRTPKIHK